MSALDPDRIGRLERLVANLQELALHWNGQFTEQFGAHPAQSSYRPADIQPQRLPHRG